MKTIIWITLLLLLGCAAGAQTALVTELSNTDAAQAKQLYEAKIAADKAWDEAYSRIVGKYQGFPGGAEFSKDFRFIVPKPPVTGGVAWGSNCSCGGCIFSTPAAGGFGGLTFDSPYVVK